MNALSAEECKTGALPDPHDVVDNRGAPIITGALNGSRFVAGMGTKLDPRRIDLFPFHRPRVQVAQDCVSHSIANRVQVLMGIRDRGTPSKRLSVAFSYAGAQHLYTPGEFPDTGSSDYLTLKWWRDHGCVSEEAYPETIENCTQLPPDDLWQRAAAATLTGCHRLEEGSSAPDEICAALALAELGHITSPGIIVTADDKMGALPPDGVCDGPGGKVWGGHALGVGSYEPSIGLTGAFGVYDTWGRVRFYFTREYVAKYGRGMIVSEAAPTAPIQ